MPHTRPFIGLIAALTLAPTLASSQITRDPVIKTFTAVAPAPAGPVPSGLRAGPTPTSIRLSWTCTQGATGYEVFAAPPGGAPVKLTATPVGPQCYQDVSQNLKLDPTLVSTTTYITSFTHGGLAPLAEFGYVVRALYPTGFADSPALAARTTPWPAPAGVTAALYVRTANLKWNPIAGALGYLVFRQSPGQSSPQQITAAPLTTAEFRQDLPVGTHQYYVQAVNGYPSAAVALVVGRPQYVSVAVYRGKPTVDFRWGATDDATGLSLVRASGAGGPFAPVKAQFAKNSWARDAGATVGATQFYKIVVTYPTVVLESEVLAATIANPPVGITNLRGTSPGPGTIKLTWICDPEAIGYSMLRGKGTDPMEWIKLYGNTAPMVITTCEYTDTNLWNGATYRYNVIAKYSDPNTSSSAQVSVAISP